MRRSIVHLILLMNNQRAE